MKSSIVKRSPSKRQPRKRRIVHTQGVLAVSNAIGIYPDMEIFGVLSGQFHFINIIEHVISQVKEPVTLDVSSWTIAKFETSKLATISQSENVRRFRAIVDSSMLSLVPSSFGFLRDMIGDDSIRFLRCHAKFAVISSKTWNIAIRTSMNLNQNKRLENFEISDCVILASYLGEIVDEIFSTPFSLKINIDSVGRDRTPQEGHGDLLVSFTKRKGVISDDFFS